MPSMADEKKEEGGETKTAGDSLSDDTLNRLTARIVAPTLKSSGSDHPPRLPGASLPDSQEKAADAPTSASSPVSQPQGEEDSLPSSPEVSAESPEPVEILEGEMLEPEESSPAPSFARLPAPSKVPKPLKPPEPPKELKPHHTKQKFEVPKAIGEFASQEKITVAGHSKIMKALKAIPAVNVTDATSMITQENCAFWYRVALGRIGGLNPRQIASMAKIDSALVTKLIRSSAFLDFERKIREVEASQPEVTKARSDVTGMLPAAVKMHQRFLTVKEKDFVRMAPHILAAIKMVYAAAGIMTPETRKAEAEMEAAGRQKDLPDITIEKMVVAVTMKGAG